MIKTYVSTTLSMLDIMSVTSPSGCSNASLEVKALNRQEAAIQSTFK